MSNSPSKNILIIQTAFIGDTILASHFAREVKLCFPDSNIHFVLRRGNESVIQGLSTISQTWIWDKKGGKFRNLFKLIKKLRKIRFDIVFNLHRHANSGLISTCMHSPVKVGFKENPLSFFYSHKKNHIIPHHPKNNSEVPLHEVDRNFELLQLIYPSHKKQILRPELPLQQKDFDKVKNYKSSPYFVIAPASVWFTKAWSEHKFRELTMELVNWGKVYFIGAPTDLDLCARITKDVPLTENLCGKLSLLESAALMKDALRVFVNDSAPLHLASCVNAKTTAIFCSTVPAFGYTPLAENSVVIDMENQLTCRPCGLHGHKNCPKGHFACSENIEVSRVVSTHLSQ
jgi:ADP-heptose:LPS heptosyltransferase